MVGNSCDVIGVVQSLDEPVTWQPTIVMSDEAYGVVAVHLFVFCALFCLSVFFVV